MQKAGGDAGLSARDTAINTFLANAGWPGATRSLLAGDASARIYERLALSSGATAILMDSAEDSPIGGFVRIAGWLRSVGVHAPRVLASDDMQGLVLLEDLGDDLVADIAIDEAERPMYEAVVDLLLHLQRQTPPAFLPPLDAPTLLQLMELFLEYEIPKLAERQRESFRQAWRGALPLVETGQPVFVHRDFHAENLVWCEGAPGNERVGVLDFQDAFVGPAAYDLVSLLADARRDLSPDLGEVLIRRYLAGRPDLDPPAFRAAFALLTAQRAMRILGIFERLALHRGRPQYRAYKPRVRRHLAQALAHPALAEIKDWCGRNYPPVREEG